MQKHDITTKEAIKAITEDIAIYILEIDIKDVEFIDKELLRIEKREADIVAACLIDNNPSILHLEIQNSNDTNMAARMLRYRLDIMNANKDDLPIRQFVVYTGKDKLNTPDNIIQERLSYSYTVIDMHTIDCEKFIKMDTPEALVLAILCDFKNKNAKDVIFYIMTRLNELTKSDDRARNKYNQMLETLSENRNLKKTMKEVEDMLSEITIEQLPSYEIGMERGIQRGIERGIERGKLEGKLESAFVMLDFGIKPEDIANKLDIPLEEIIKRMDKR